MDWNRTVYFAGVRVYRRYTQIVLGLQLKVHAVKYFWYKKMCKLIVFYFHLFQKALLVC